jgi:hypothetical protein
MDASTSVNHNVWYRPLDTSDDSLGTETVIFDAVTIGTNQTGQHVSITKSRGGHLYASANVDNGTEVGFFRSDDAGATWDTLTEDYEAAPDTMMLLPGGLADNQDIWAVYNDASANAVTLKTYDASGDTWTESATIVTQVENSSVTVGYYPWGASIRPSDNHLILAIWTERDAATGDFRVFDIADGATITEKTALATDKDDSYFPQVYIDPADRIYVSYTGKLDGSETLGTTVNVYYAVSTDGGTTWASTDNLVSETGGNIVQNYAPLNGQRFLVVWCFDDTNDSYVTNATNSVGFGISSTGNPDINSAIWDALHTHYAATLPSGPDNTQLVTRYLSDNPADITDMSARFQDLIADAR